MYAMEKQKKGWIKMAEKLLIIFLSLCCLSFVAYIAFLVVACLLLIILKAEQIIRKVYKKWIR